MSQPRSIEDMLSLVTDEAVDKENSEFSSFFPKSEQLSNTQNKASSVSRKVTKSSSKKGESSLNHPLKHRKNQPKSGQEFDANEALENSEPNQKLSDKKSKYDRRSSFSLRGKRKSSFGELQTTLHSDINPENFAQHISPDLPDPVRLRQLLVYSIQRELERLANDQTDGNVSDILDDVCQKLLEKKINTSWYHRPRDQIPVVLKPNPQNLELEARIRGLELEIEKLEKIEAEWSKIPEQIESEQRKIAEAIVSRKNVSQAHNSHESELSKIVDALPDNLKSQIGKQVEVFNEELEQIKDVSGIENQINFLLTKLHQLQVFIQERHGQVDDLFTKLIDACWPDDDEMEQQIHSGDSESKNGRKRRMSKAQVRRASLLGLPIPSPLKSSQNELNDLEDKTMSFLRLLSSALSQNQA